ASQGHIEARRAISAYYGARGLAVDPAGVVLSASTSEAYGWFFSLLADAEDTVLIPRPSYPLLGWCAATQRVALVSCQLQRDVGFRIDMGELRRSIDARTRAIVLVHPNNPTGSFVRRDEASELAAIAREHGLALIADEVFGDYALEAPDDRVPSFLELSDP